MSDELDGLDDFTDQNWGAPDTAEQPAAAPPPAAAPAAAPGPEVAGTLTEEHLSSLFSANLMPGDQSGSAAVRRGQIAVAGGVGVFLALLAGGHMFAMSQQSAAEERLTQASEQVVGLESDVAALDEFSRLRDQRDAVDGKVIGLFADQPDVALALSRLSETLPADYRGSVSLAFSEPKVAEFHRGQPLVFGDVSLDGDIGGTVETIPGEVQDPLLNDPLFVSPVVASVENGDGGVANFSATASMSQELLTLQWALGLTPDIADALLSVDEQLRPTTTPLYVPVDVDGDEVPDKYVPVDELEEGDVPLVELPDDEPVGQEPTDDESAAAAADEEQS